MSLSAPPLEVAVAGGSLAAYDLSPAASDELPLVVAVHGITGNSHAWLAVARELAGRVRVVAPDLRGRGASTALPPPYGMAAHADDLRALLDHLGAEHAVFAGHSLGGYIVARLAADHPDRVRTAVLVDGGLTIPSAGEGVDPQEFADAFLGPALARLKLTFASLEEYLAWWRAHPAFSHDDVGDDDLAAYAAHDLTGEPPEQHSSVAEPAVRGDAAELFEMGAAAHRLALPAVLLCAERGLLDQPEPMQPAGLVAEWVAEDPERRRMVEVAGVNHYTITMGAAGSRAVGAELLSAAEAG